MADGFDLKAPTASMLAKRAEMEANDRDRERRRAGRPALEPGMTLQGRVVDRNGDATVVGCLVADADADHVILLCLDYPPLTITLPGARKQLARNAGRLVTLDKTDVDWPSVYEETPAQRRLTMHAKARAACLALGVGSGYLSEREQELWEAAAVLLGEAG